ncbi:Tn3 family transposase [Streptomyces sp. NRRL S-15]|uniref:Tn3 family transposase n=1 Tax=Streptomyces sp. NRRL S-15 TaxID=1463886 RepID=UPI0004C96080|nr:Tn3 family transposase [Streptomyces sp. NRRL S-15]
MGPYEAARHIPGVSGHELSLAANRHFSIPTLNGAIADLGNAHARLDISQAPRIRNREDLLLPVSYIHL